MSPANITLVVSLTSGFYYKTSSNWRSQGQQRPSSNILERIIRISSSSSSSSGLMLKLLLLLISTRRIQRAATYRLINVIRQRATGVWVAGLNIASSGYDLTVAISWLTSNSRDRYVASSLLSCAWSNVAGRRAPWQQRQMMCRKRRLSLYELTSPPSNRRTLPSWHDDDDDDANVNTNTHTHTHTHTYGKMSHRLQGSHILYWQKNPVDFPGPPWKTFQDLFGARECLNIKKKTAFTYNIQSVIHCKKIQHEAKCGR